MSAGRGAHGRPPSGHGGRLGWLAVALLAAALGACTGTFTPPLPTLYLVLADAEGAESAARVALLDFVASPTERRLDLLNDRAFVFPAGERLLALDVRDREERREAWVLTAVGAPDARAVRLHRLDLRALGDAPGAIVPAVGPARDLTDADGTWVDLAAASGLPTGCLSGLTVATDGRRVALWDAGGGGRCGAADDLGEPRVHVIDLEAATASDPVAEARAPGVRPADPTAAERLLLVRRPAVGALDERAVFTVDYAAPEPPAFASGTVVAGLLDVAGVPGGFAALRAVDGGGAREVELHVGDAVTKREMPASAGGLRVDDTGRLGVLVTLGGGRVGVAYPNEPAPRSVVFDARDATIEPLNAYALAVRSGGVCVIDLLVSGSGPGCDLVVAPEVGAALVGARLVTWAYAEPSAP